MAEEHVRIPIDPDLAPTDPAEPVAHGSRRRAVLGHERLRPDVLAVIALGGMLGATARFELAEAMPVEPGRFPWATFVTNVAGSFVLGLLLVLLLERARPTRYLRPFLATGVLGAFTTMSTFLVETALLVKDGHAATATTYAVASLVFGIGLAWGGIRLGRVGR